MGIQSWSEDILLVDLPAEPDLGEELKTVITTVRDRGDCDVVIDFSGRPGLEMHVPFTSGMIGSFDSQLAFEFFQGFANHAFVTLHIDNLKGANAHHQCETVFKAFARALRAALELDPRSAGMIPSTKGSL